MTLCSEVLPDKIKENLKADIDNYLFNGGKIENVPLGKSTPVDATNNWPSGFHNDDNVTFTKKRPRSHV